MWHMGDGWGWWMGFGSLGMLLVMVLVVWAVYTLVTRRAADGDRQQSAEPEPVTILERRYARGDITAEQFEEMRSRLGYRDGPRRKSA